MTQYKCRFHQRGRRWRRRQDHKRTQPRRTKRLYRHFKPQITGSSQSPTSHTHNSSQRTLHNNNNGDNNNTSSTKQKNTVARTYATMPRASSARATRSSRSGSISAATPPVPLSNRTNNGKANIGKDSARGKRPSIRRTSSSGAAELDLMSPTSQKPRKPEMSLPHSVSSATNINHANIARRRNSNRLKRQSSSSSLKPAEKPEVMQHAPSTPPRVSDRDKENAADNSEGVMQSPTPYWKILEERKASGKVVTTPPLTRSARKKRMNTTQPSGGGCGLMMFSPPNQRENARRERDEIARKERERSQRIQKCKNGGQLLVFSADMTNVNGGNFSDADSAADARNDDGDDGMDVDEDSDADADVKSLITPRNLAATTASSASNTPSDISENSSATTNTNNATELTAELKSIRTAVEGILEAKASMADGSHRSSQSNQDLLKTMQQILAMQQEQNKNKTVISDSSLNELKERTSDLVVQNTKLEGTIDKLEKTLAATKQEQKEITEELQESLENARLESTGKERCLEEARKKMQERLTQLQQENEDIKASMASLEAANKTLHTKLREAKAMVAQLQEQIQQETQSMSHVTEEVVAEKEKVKEEVGSLMKQMEAFEEQSEHYQHTIDLLENELLPESEEQLRKANSDLEEKMEYAMELEARLEESETEMAKLKDDLARAITERDDERLTFQQLNEKSDLAHKQFSDEITAKAEEISKLEFELENAKNACDERQVKADGISMEFRSTQKSLGERIAQLEAALRDALAKLERTETLNAHLQEQLQRATDRVRQGEAFKTETLVTQEKTNVTISDMSNENLSLRERVKLLEAQLKTTSTERSDAFARLESFDARENELFMKLRESDRVRRGLHNQVMKLSGNIRVFVRVRPALGSEMEAEQAAAQAKSASGSHAGRKRKHQETPPVESPFNFPGIYDRERTTKKVARSSGVVSSGGAEDVTKNLVLVTAPRKDRGGLSERRKTHKFGFDRVFHQEHCQKDVWEAAEPLVQSAIDGFNVTLFAYGQTGSGKTYTMLGEPGNEGLITRAVNRLFESKDEIIQYSKGTSTVEISMELLEIYNEKIRDLLSNKETETNGKEDELKVSASEVVGNARLATKSQSEVLKILEHAQKRRCVKATASNAVSSRGHMIFTIHFVVKVQNGATRAGKLHICDLAGSERLGKSNANEVVGGALLEETKNINSSLSVLSNVIEKLQAGSPQVPYRESKLTRLLQNSLGGNSKTLAIVCCNPLPSHYSESMCSLRFADKVNRVDLKAVANFSC